MRHLAGPPPPAIRLIGRPSLLTDGGEGIRRRDREPGEPHALPTTQTAHSIHSVVPVARAHEWQTVRAPRDPALERSLAVLEQGARLVTEFKYGVEVVLFLSERTPLQEGHVLVEHGRIPR